MSIQIQLYGLNFA
uniref:Uncharacterized protein n=1 Tax=Arundo donax TaxID=35708 RepID=A0A0A9F390_ARUDO